MGSRNSRWKAAGWSVVAVLLPFGLYMSGYYRTVVRGAEAWETPEGRFVSIRAGYVLQWPIPAHYNSPWLADFLDDVFAPAHQLDRLARPQSWPETYFVHNPEVLPVSGDVGLEGPLTSVMEPPENVGQQP